MASDLEKRKRLVALIYALLFLGLFALATAIAINRKIEDARNDREAAPPSSMSQVAPVASR